MRNSVSKMTTEELKNLEADIRNRKRELDYEAKKIVWIIESSWFIDKAYREEEYCLAMERIKEIAEDAKDRYINNIKENIPVDIRRSFDMRNIPVVKRLIVPESEYEGYFKQ